MVRLRSALEGGRLVKGGGAVDRGEMGCKDKYSYFPPPPHLAASHPANTNTTNTVPLYWKIDKQDE